MYTEAEEYWPKLADWSRLRRQLKAHETIAELVDSKPWLFGYEHRVELIPGHEGYDASGAGRALVAFLPHKCSRLGAVLASEDYTEKIFIAGAPPSPLRAWRLDAVKEINADLIKGSRVVEMSTFGHRSTIKGLADLLCDDSSLLWKYDVHFAVLGSKLQTIGSWVFTQLVPSITAITSVPSRYYSEAFSEGIGASWVFPLARTNSRR